MRLDYGEKSRLIGRKITNVSDAGDALLIELDNGKVLRVGSGFEENFSGPTCPSVMVLLDGRKIWSLREST